MKKRWREAAKIKSKVLTRQTSHQKNDEAWTPQSVPTNLSFRQMSLYSEELECILEEHTTDQIAFFLYLVAVATFNIIYWVIYIM